MSGPTKEVAWLFGGYRIVRTFYRSGPGKHALEQALTDQMGEPSRCAVGELDSNEPETYTPSTPESFLRAVVKHSKAKQTKGTK